MNRVNPRGALCRVLVMVGLASSFGCESAPETRSYPGLSSEEVARLPQPAVRPPTDDTRPAAEEPPSPQNDPFATPEPAVPDPGSLMAPSAPGATAQAAGATGGEPEKKKRDLSAELKAALGEPIDCLDLSQLPPTGGKITIQVGAYVGPSGRISRASVSASGQPPSTLACVEKRALAIKMQDPIDDAPVLVNARVDFDITRAPTKAAPAPTPPPPAPTY